MKSPASARSTLLLPLVGLLLGCGAAAVQSPIAAPDIVGARAVGHAASAPLVHPSMRSVDSMLAATYPATGPGAAAIVARNGEILLRNAYGLANVELAVPMTPEHIFRLGSITKQFTAVATLLLVDEGRISLDDEITRFFPDWPTHGHRITVEHLLTHTSGIRSYTGMPTFGSMVRRDLPLDELIAFFRDEPMDFAPGDDWRYNNSAYVLLGAIIEQVSGETYADFTRTRIFEPLGMMDTGYEDVGQLLPRRASGYAMAAGREIRNAEYLSMSLPHAAGALVSTVDDQLRWQRAVAEQRLLRPATWERAFQPFTLSDGRSSGYGYGWFIGNAAGLPTVEHGGDINGFATEGIWIPSAGLHIVVLSNVTRNFANPNMPALAAASIVGGLSTQPGAVRLSEGDLDVYAGVYLTPEGDRRIVFREGDALFSVRGDGPRQQMIPLGGDDFVYADSPTRIAFTRDAAGGVAGMRLAPRLGPEQKPAMRTAESPDALLAASRETVDVPSERLDRYVGEYQLAPGMVIAISRSADGIVARATGQSEVQLIPRSQTRFSFQGVPGSIEFEMDESGDVTGLVLLQGGGRMPAPRIS